MRILAICSLLFATLGCDRLRGSVADRGPITLEERPDLANYGSVSTAGSLKLVLTPSAERTLELEGTAGGIANTTTEVESGELRIRCVDTNRKRSCETVTAKVSLPTIAALKLSGSGTTTATAPFTGTHVEIVSSGSGKLTLELTGTDVTMTSSGSGSTTLQGTAGKASFALSGSGSLNADQLKTKHVTTRISGSGSAIIHATETLSATINGSGSITYAGSPEVKQTINGSGNIAPR